MFYFINYKTSVDTADTDAIKFAPTCSDLEINIKQYLLLYEPRLIGTRKRIKKFQSVLSILLTLLMINI